MHTWLVWFSIIFPVSRQAKGSLHHLHNVYPDMSFLRVIPIPEPVFGFRSCTVQHCFSTKHSFPTKHALAVPSPPRLCLLGTLELTCWGSGDLCHVSAEPWTFWFLRTTYLHIQMTGTETAFVKADSILGNKESAYSK